MVHGIKVLAYDLLVGVFGGLVVEAHAELLEHLGGVREIVGPRLEDGVSVGVELRLLVSSLDARLGQ